MHNRRHRDYEEIKERKGNLNWLVMRHIDGHLEGNGDTKNPKTRKLRQLLDEEGEKVSLVWVPGHKDITWNKMADIETRTALALDVVIVIHPTETYPPQDLAKWLTIKTIESQNLK
jgi:ribonuclease HI